MLKLLVIERRDCAMNYKKDIENRHLYYGKLYH